MKIRNGFVSNSSSSSFTCDVCGDTESGFDISLDDIEMAECINGHIFCKSHMPNIGEYDNIDYLEAFNNFSEKELKDNHKIKSFKKLKEEIKALNKDESFNEAKDFITWYGLPKAYCPICMMIEPKADEVSEYLYKKNKTNQSEVFEEIKKTFSDYDSFQKFLEYKDES